MDIKSLYTVIPNNGGLEALTYYLDQRSIKEPPTHTLTRLAELVLTLNAFCFNDQHYRQIGGVAMGTKMGPNYACLFVGFIEERIRAQYTGFVPQLHKRYIDDVVGAAQCTRPELEQFIDYVCNFHPALQFTFNISELELPFLDIKLAITNIRNRSPGLPVAEHFNSANHTIDDVRVCGVKQCSGSNTSRKQREMQLIFELGTLKPGGLNINFSFI